MGGHLGAQVFVDQEAVGIELFARERDDDLRFVQPLDVEWNEDLAEVHLRPHAPGAAGRRPHHRCWLAVDHAAAGGARSPIDCVLERTRDRIIELGSDEQETVRADYPRERDELNLERVPAGENDSGKIETLPDGSISVPLFEEELVVTKRKVLRERVIIRKDTVRDWESVQAELRREHISFETCDLPQGSIEP